MFIMYYGVLITGTLMWAYVLLKLLKELVRSIWQTVRISRHLLSQDPKPTGVKLKHYITMWANEFGTSYTTKRIAWQDFPFYPWHSIDLEEDED